MLNLKELREREGLKQSDVARRLRVTQTAVSRWESGKNLINRRNRRALARLYGTSEEKIGELARLCRGEKNE